MEDKLEYYLTQFSEIANAYFEEHQWLPERFEYFNAFFKRENLLNAQWEDFQAMGNCIHAFNSLAIAKQNALGRPNLPIEKYREIFQYIADSKDNLDIVMKDHVAGICEALIPYPEVVGVK